MILLLAVMPNVVHIGHGPTSVGHTHAPHSTVNHAQQDAESGTHTEHCHGNTTQCSGPALVSVGLVADDSADLYGSQQLRIRYADVGVHALDGLASLVTPPPRA
jgi:hypothetical protein